jgi:hypothetical protein
MAGFVKNLFDLRFEKKREVFLDNWETVSFLGGFRCMELVGFQSAVWAIKYTVRTAKKTQHFTVPKINRLTLFKEIIAAYSENQTKYMNTLCGHNVGGTLVTTVLWRANRSYLLRSPFRPFIVVDGCFPISFYGM